MFVENSYVLEIFLFRGYPYFLETFIFRDDCIDNFEVKATTVI